MAKGKTKQKQYHPLIGILAVLLLAVIAAVVVKNRNDNDAADSALVKHQAALATSQAPKLKNMLIVSSQKAGTTVDIDEVSLQKSGYVAIHANDNGKPGKIVAHSNLLTAGTKQDLIIRYTTKVGSSYFAMLHSDDGNGVFNETKDLPLKGSDAMPIMTMFMIVK